MAFKKQSLGKGLDALFAENEVEIDEKQIKLVKTSLVEPNKDQPRRTFDKAALSDLASSIAEHGILQPIIVRKYGEGYQIISGERRWRASRMAGLQEIPVIIREIDDTDALVIGLIENLQREDLNVVEEALGYKRLMESFSYTQEAISKRVGKSRPVIANALRLLALPKCVLDAAENGDITAGHARAFLPLCEKLSEKEIVDLLEQTVNKELTVRDLEALYKKLSTEKAEKSSDPNSIYYKALETDMSATMGRKIKIVPKRGKGRIEIEFYNKNDFEILVEALKKIKTE